MAYYKYRGERGKTTVANSFPEFYLGCCQNPFNFKKLEGGKKKKKKNPRDPGSNL